MLDELRELCALHGVSGHEGPVREYILSRIDGCADVRVDALGNVLALKRGENRAAVRVMLDAHMDEVGVLVAGAAEDGTLYFASIGVDVRVLLGRRVRFANGAAGVIGLPPVHLLKESDRKKLPELDSLRIDIGADSREKALAAVRVGDTAVFDTRFVETDRIIRSRALDDRVGCAALISLVRAPQPFDLRISFSVQEEVGARGAKTAAYQLEPEAAIALETTTAADLPNTPEGKQVCRLGGGVAVSFMDRGAVYDTALYREAFRVAKELGLPCQPKAAVASGTNAGAIHTSRGGARALTLSVPCRYLHSGVCLANKADIAALPGLVGELAARVASDSFF